MKKKIFCVLLCSVFIFLFSLQCFAYYPTGTTPSEIGQRLTEITESGIYIMKMTTQYNTSPFRLFYNNQGVAYIGAFMQQTGYYRYMSSSFDIQNTTPHRTITAVSGLIDLNSYINQYVIIYIDCTNWENLSLSVINDEVYEYKPTIEDLQELLDNAYNEGYESGTIQGILQGYTNGFNDAIIGQEQLNLVQHVNKAVGFFIGDEYAPYVTPFAIAFTLLMAYFIFIRWILLFAKSTKAMKIADIVVVAACIGIMAVMYINMFTINIHNTNVTESVYQIASDIAVGG